MVAMSKPTLTMGEVVELIVPRLAVVAGERGLEREVSWVHVSELADPTPFLEGRELLITTGLGVGKTESTQEAYVRRLADHGLAGLAFGVGFDFDDVPDPIARAADALDFPVLAVPYEVPFVAITRAVARELANGQLAELRKALEVHERLAAAVLEGRGIDALLSIVCNHLGCGIALIDESGRVPNERRLRHHQRGGIQLELPIIESGEELVTLRATRDGADWTEYDHLVLHHMRTAVAFELSRLRAVSEAELRLAGDLLDDLEHGRLEDRAAARRLAAFGLDPSKRHAALVVVPGSTEAVGRVRADVAAALETSRRVYLSATRRDRADFVVEVAHADDALALARKLAGASPEARLGVGRPSEGAGIGRSLAEARAAVETTPGRVASYRDLGSLELLLGLPDAALNAYIDRVLGAASANEVLIESLTALLDSGCQWSAAAARIPIHRHTLRYRMDRMRELTGLHPDVPEQRMELWLAIKARQVLSARGEAPVA